MTKKEQAFVDSLKIQAALSWPKFEKPSPSTIKVPCDEYRAVWFQNAFSGRVSLGWTSGNRHNDNAPIPDKDTRYSGNFQGPGRYYETRLEALRAMRWEEAEDCARRLLRIDEMIKKEMTA